MEPECLGCGICPPDGADGCFDFDELAIRRNDAGDPYWFFAHASPKCRARAIEQAYIRAGWEKAVCIFPACPLPRKSPYYCEGHKIAYHAGKITSEQTTTYIQTQAITK